jgi:hypothetical protein
MELNLVWNYFGVVPAVVSSWDISIQVRIGYTLTGLWVAFYASHGFPDNILKNVTIGNWS